MAAASIIKQLAVASYTQGELDAKKVNKIADKLSRAVLKQYIRELKKLERQHTVYVDSAYEVDETLKKAFLDLYPDKKIVYNTDSSLLLGIKVLDNDKVYEMTLENTLENIAQYIEENYD